MITTDRMSASVAIEVQEAVERLIPVLEQFSAEELEAMYARLSAVLDRRAATEAQPVHA